MKKNKQLLIHIGTMKTGTTALQRFLSENNELLQQYGWSYPDIRQEITSVDFGQVETTNEGKVWAKYINARVFRMFYESEYVISEEERTILWKELWELLYSHLEHHNVILSDERFWWSCPKEVYKKIKSQYDNVKIIVYLRRQDRYVESYWNQRVKRLASFSEDFHDILKRGGLKCSYIGKLEELEEIFGLENIIVRGYEKQQFEGDRKDVISDFFSAIDLTPDWDKCVTIVSENESLNGNYLEIKRILNKTLQDGDVASERINDIFHEILLGQKTSCITHIEGYFNKEERKVFLNSVMEENEKIARKYLKRQDGVLFYDMGLDIPEYRVDENIYEDIIKTFGVYIRDVQQQIFNLQSMIDKGPEKGD